MRILVIGGTHFIGPWAVRRLAEAGHRVTVLHRGVTEADLPAEVEHLHAGSDIGDRAYFRGLTGEFRRIAPDVVLDMTGYTEADAVMLVETFRGIAGRTVVASSMDVYRAYDVLRGKESGPPDPAPLTEDSPLRTRLYPYREEAPRAAEESRRFLHDYDKILVERVVMGEPVLPGTIVRLPMVHGPGDYQHRLADALKRIGDGRSAILLDERTARWSGPRGYVENVGDALALAVADERAAGRIYHVAEPHAITETEWLGRIGRAAGWSGEVVVLPAAQMPAHLAPLAGGVQDWTADSSRIRNEIGYAERVDLDEGLRRTIAWERANPPAKFDPAQFDYAAEDAALRAAARTPGAAA